NTAAAIRPTTKPSLFHLADSPTPRGARRMSYYAAQGPPSRFKPADDPSKADESGPRRSDTRDIHWPFTEALDLTLLQPQPDTFADPPDGALRSLQPITDLLRGIAFKAQFNHRPLGFVQSDEQSVHGLGQDEGFVRSRFPTDWVWPDRPVRPG